MVGLVIKLGPHERFYINGAMVENGPRRTQFCLMRADTEILRERDIIPSDAAADTLGTACVLAQSILMIRAGREEIVARLLVQMRTLLHDPDHRGNTLVIEAAKRLSEGAHSGTHYALLRALRQRAARAAAALATTPDACMNAACDTTYTSTCINTNIGSGPTRLQ